MSMSEQDARGPEEHDKSAFSAGRGRGRRCRAGPAPCRPGSCRRRHQRAVLRERRGNRPCPPRSWRRGRRAARVSGRSCSKTGAEILDQRRLDRRRLPGVAAGPATDSDICRIVQNRAAKRPMIVASSLEPAGGPARAGTRAARERRQAPVGAAALVGQLAGHLLPAGAISPSSMSSGTKTSSNATSLKWCRRRGRGSARS